jgi:hypothetical protein
MEKQPLYLEAIVLEISPVERISRQDKPTFYKQRATFLTPCGVIIIDAIGSKVRILENISLEEKVKISFFFSARNGHNNHTLKSIEKLC